MFLYSHPVSVLPPESFPGSARTSPEFAGEYASCLIMHRVTRVAAGTCLLPGADGLVALLSALSQQPLQTVTLRHLPALGGCHAAYLGAAPGAGRDLVALVLIAQLMPLGDTLTVAANAGGNDASANGNGIGNGNGSGSRGSGSGNGGGGDMSACMHVVFQLAVRSSCQELAHCVRAHAADWVRDMSLGCACEGLAPPSGAGAAAAAASGTPLLHPAVAPVRVAYAAPAPAPAARAAPAVLQIPAAQLAAMQLQQGAGEGGAAAAGGAAVAASADAPQPPQQPPAYNSEDESSGDEEQAERDADRFDAWIRSMAEAEWKAVAVAL